ncbi:hypothetical protein PG994_014484 [Apiospora phragmitis]|uniref:Uncharacterized protein n=1 Tax=Apiospora phragmitis TaxID=2905665 RepID=A0ABR1T4G6_9PEZI
MTELHRAASLAIPFDQIYPLIVMLYKNHVSIQGRDEKREDSVIFARDCAPETHYSKYPPMMPKFVRAAIQILRPGTNQMTVVHAEPRVNNSTPPNRRDSLDTSAWEDEQHPMNPIHHTEVRLNVRQTYHAEAWRHFLAAIADDGVESLDIEKILPVPSLPRVADVKQQRRSTPDTYQATTAAETIASRIHVLQHLNETKKTRAAGRLANALQFQAITNCLVARSGQEGENIYSAKIAQVDQWLTDDANIITNASTDYLPS